MTILKNPLHLQGLPSPCPRNMISQGTRSATPSFPCSEMRVHSTPHSGSRGIHAEQTIAQGGCSGDAQSRGAIRRTRERADRSLRAMRPPPPVPPARVHVPRALDVAPSARVSRGLRRAPDPLLRTDPRPTLAFPHRGRVTRRGDTGGGGGRLEHGTGTRAPQVLLGGTQKKDTDTPSRANFHSPRKNTSSTDATPTPPRHAGPGPRSFAARLTAWTTRLTR